MNVRLAILFSAVAEEKSFTRAAARLNIAQPWLSAQVRKFEEQLGFPLFDRNKGGIELTAEAERMLPLALELAEKAAQLRALSRAIALDVSLSVGVGAHASSGGVPEFARLNDEFAVRYQDASLMIESGVTAGLIEEVNGGRLDVALVMAPFDDEGLQSILLRQSPAFVLTPKDSPLAALARLRPSDLVGRRLAVVRRSDQPDFYDALCAPLERLGVQLRAAPETSGRAMEHFARAQHADVLMVEGDPADYQGDPELAARPLEADVQVRHVLIRRADNHKRAVERYWRAAEALVAAQQPA
ncbi:MAG: hypothetical protein JWR84_3086 [Caulobacter sp.]|nr:hypothetical protein [Caulobacter sp.]